jgi:hypothetical protein
MRMHLNEIDADIWRVTEEGTDILEGATTETKKKDKHRDSMALMLYSTDYVKKSLHASTTLTQHMKSRLQSSMYTKALLK